MSRHALPSLAFQDVDAVKRLVRFRDRQLEAIKGPKSPRGRRQLAGLFECLLEMVLQGNSLHPQNPLHLAESAAKALRNKSRPPAALRGLLDLLVDDAGIPRPGFNAFVANSPDTIRHHEFQRKSGSFEASYKAPHKFTLYRRQVMESAEFWRDWGAIKRHHRIARFQDANGIIRRSPNPEYNWRKPEWPDLTDARTAFRVAFDFFCWKWFLWGMRRDEPLVEKLFYAITPYGTQIFIPGYWSLDATRDIHWEEIKRLHSARGVAKQGAKLVANQLQRAGQLKRLLATDDACKRQGIRGASRYTLLKTAAGLVPQTDDAQVRQLLRMARKPQPSAPLKSTLSSKNFHHLTRP